MVLGCIPKCRTRVSFSPQPVYVRSIQGHGSMKIEFFYLCDVNVIASLYHIATFTLCKTTHTKIRYYTKNAIVQDIFGSSTT